MECPYCKAELEGEPYRYGTHHEWGYGINTYWDEYRCTCPECGETFRWYENYTWDSDETRKMEE